MSSIYVCVCVGGGGWDGERGNREVCMCGKNVHVCVWEERETQIM